MQSIPKICEQIENKYETITILDFPSSSVITNNGILTYYEWLRKIQKKISYPTKIIFYKGLCALAPLNIEKR